MLKKMKFTAAVLLVIISLFTLLQPANNVNSETNSGKYDQQVNSILEKMTLKEKVGQLIQIDNSRLMKGYPKKGELDPQTLQKVIVDYGVGSILVGGDSAPVKNTVEGWTATTNKIQEYAAKTRLKIPVIIGVDAVHGFNNIIGSTVYPHNLGIAATWNTTLTKNYAAKTTEELSAAGIHWTFAPVLDVAQNPRWGRTYETFGEDPYLVSMMGKSQIEGFQSTNKVAACAKHFLGYSGSERGIDRAPIDISEKTIREIFLPPFKQAIQSSVKTMMINSAEVNGVPAHASRWLLTDVLREELGFAGMTVSDWADIHSLNDRHKVAPSFVDSVARSFNAGLDMSMTPLDFDTADILVNLVNDKVVDVSRIDEAVKRVLTLKYELGLFDRKPADSVKLKSLVGNTASRSLAKQTASQSVTLLKNQSNRLPLSKKATSILVVGDGANSKNMLCGGWTVGWQGATDSQLPLGDTIYNAIKKEVSSSTKVNYLATTANADSIKKAAASASVCVAVVAEKPYTEGKGDVENLNISQAQLNMLQALYNAKKPVVLVVVSGRPLDLTWASERSAAVLWAYLPGTEGAGAIADILFGDTNPSGKLPITIPKNSYQLPMVYNSRVTAKYDPLYPFGYGLSYTTYLYSDLVVASSVKQGENLKVTVKVKNTGKVAGEEVVQLYSQDLYSSVSPRRLQLKGFTRLSLKAGETKTATFQLTPEQLSILDEDLNWVEEPRNIKITVGKLTQAVSITK